MGNFFTRDRFGHPQVIAAGLLLVFAAQCCWLVTRTNPQEIDANQLFRVQEGLLQIQGDAVAGTPSMARLEAGVTVPPEIEGNEGYDPDHSPLWYLVAAAPLASWSQHGKPARFVVRYWGWLARSPYLVFGLLLGASLWYVSRRLYGNQGGYIALMLYCFSPGILRGSTLWRAQPELGAAWGTFGAVFTAIAVAHTLYAPREVIVWNRRRILLLGLSLALAIGSQFSLIILAPIALGFMLYLAPARQKAALAIWAAACLVALLLLLASYDFRFGVFWQGLRHASFFGFTWRTLTMAEAYRAALLRLQESAAVLLIALPAALVSYGLWPRTRYFGNTAPLLVALLFLALGFCSPHYPGLGFYLMAVPFLFVFVAGICADLLETPERKFVLACVWGLLAVIALANLWHLARVAAASS
jgi:hypothetical protein